VELKEFIKGFNQVLPRNLVGVFEPHELQFLISGIPEISLADWKKNTTYNGVFHQNHNVIKWFWSILESFTQAELRRFLLFCTGMPRVPIEGFKALQSNRNNVCLF